jgi:hypothetical protein
MCFHRASSYSHQQLGGLGLQDLVNAQDCVLRAPKVEEAKQV